MPNDTLYPNFFETINEAAMRLRGTVILYEGRPYYVLTLGDTPTDNIIRLYLDPIGEPNSVFNISGADVPPYDNMSVGHPHVRPLMDEWLAAHPKSPILRKKINSPGFNKFRPFPLGMVNVGDDCVYVERQPLRKSEQGLIAPMLIANKVTAAGSPGTTVNMMAASFRDCVLGHYPSLTTTLAALRDKSITNHGVGFHRQFAVVKGPVGVLFLTYKTFIVGSIPNGDQSKLNLDPEYLFLKETIDEMNAFETVNIM